MGLYGNTFLNEEFCNYVSDDTELVQEAMFFLSPQGRSIKKQMKEISKKHKVSFGGEAIKRTFTVRKYDPNIANAVIKETNALFDIIHNSTGLGKYVDTTTTSDSSGKSHPAYN